MANIGGFSGISTETLVTCYIYNLITNEKIQFKTLPESISESYQGSWQPQDILGRSAPYFAFLSNSARTADYSVTLDRNILGDPQYVNTINQCKRLVYPNYAGGGIVVPPYCYVRFGGMLKMFAIIENVSLSWSGVYISGSSQSRSDRTIESNARTFTSGQEWNSYSSKESEDPNKNVLSQCEISFSFQEIRTQNQLLPTGSNLNEVDSNY